MVAPFVGAATAVLLLATTGLIVTAFVQSRRLGHFRRRLDSLTRGSDGVSLDAVLSSHLETVAAVARDLDMLAARSAALEEVTRQAIQHVGLVRFNPFEDTGGNQSFAMALTDATGAGFVLSSLHSRTGTRVYAKAVIGGRADGALSEEEAEALRRATAGLSRPPPGDARGRDRLAGPV
ncbi:MAG: DUF4446 family protein [Candidatus Limnocylindrales bacterium]